MNVTGKYAMVFHNENNGVTYYSISDSTKQQDGTYVNQSYGARFPKDTPPPTVRSKIKFEGFTSNKKASNDKVYTTIQVMKWEYMDDSTAQYDTSNTLSDETVELVEKFKQKDKEKKTDPFFASSNIDIEEDDLPFN